MVTPRTAWLFRPEVGGFPREGVLSLEEGTLRFIGVNGPELELPLADVRRARRVRASPVLQVRYRRDGARRVAFVYFTRPPEPGAGGGVIARSRARRRDRRIAIYVLTEYSRELKDELDGWVAAIREGGAQA